MVTNRLLCGLLTHMSAASSCFYPTPSCVWTLERNFWFGHFALVPRRSGRNVHSVYLMGINWWGREEGGVGCSSAADREEGVTGQEQKRRGRLLMPQEDGHVLLLMMWLLHWNVNNNWMDSFNTHIHSTQRGNWSSPEFSSAATTRPNLLFWQLFALPVVLNTLKATI